MTKKIKILRRKIAKTLASVFVIGVVVVPIFLNVRWVAGIVATHDSRSVSTLHFTPRLADQSSAPLHPFQEPIITVTFDDGWESVYTTAVPILDKDGIHTTQYIITDTFDNYSYMSVAQLRSIHDSGHEIASHTVSHPDLTTLDDGRLTFELAHSQQVLSQEFGPITDFTSPYGAYNAHTLQMISQYYRSQKNAEGDPAANELEAINTEASFNPMNITSFSVRSTTTLADLQKLIKAAQNNNAWLVLTYHQVDKSGDQFAVTPDAFRQQMQLISSTPARSATVGQVMDAWQADRRQGIKS